MILSRRKQVDGVWYRGFTLLPVKVGEARGLEKFVIGFYEYRVVRRRGDYVDYEMRLPDAKQSAVTTYNMSAAW